MIFVVLLLLALGVFLQAVATIGFLRLPDFYSRIHAVGMADTAGIACVLTGVAMTEGISYTTLKLSFVIVFYLLANPTAAHALTHAALRSGLAPHEGTERP